MGGARFRLALVNDAQLGRFFKGCGLMEIRGLCALVHWIRVEVNFGECMYTVSGWYKTLVPLCEAQLKHYFNNALV